MEPKAYWVGFNLVRGIGAVRLRNLINYFGDLQVAWHAPLDALQSAGLPPKVLDNLTQVRKGVNLEHVWDNIQQQKIQVMTWDEEAYPRRLKEIDQPPPVLYVRGELQPEDDWAVAVVGTRRMSVYGRQIAQELSHCLAQNGITVVSGLARGVDAVAHDSSLASGGRTLAILGNGVDRVYPPEHRKLAERILCNGALCSDYAPGTPPDGINFPPRNRIISGLSAATVVVEAGEKSGALITATFAAEQGREVFAVPGSMHAPQSQGTNRLIQQGARPLLKVEEVLEVFEIERASYQQAARRLIPADAVEHALLQVLGQEPIHIDEIRSLSGLSIDNVTATLTMMELKGLVRQVGGMNYVVARETPGVYEVEDHG